MYIHMYVPIGVAEDTLLGYYMFAVCQTLSELGKVNRLCKNYKVTNRGILVERRINCVDL